MAGRMAETLGYPADRLSVKDETANYLEKSNGQIIQVFRMGSETGTFASTGIAISRRGYLLKPAIEKKCEDILAAGSTSVRRFDLQGGIYGYAGLGIAGPGGSEEILIATWPDRFLDFQIKVTIPREGLAVAEETKAYHELITSDTVSLSGKLVEAMGHLTTYAEKAGIRAEHEGGAESRPTKSSGKQHEQNVVSHLAAGQNVERTEHGSVPTLRLLNLAVFALVVLVLLWVMLKRRR